MVFDGKILLKIEEKGRLLNKKIEHIYQFRETPRNVLDRKTSRSEIFYIGELEIDSSCGLYFFIEVFDQTIMENLKAAIRLLGDEGIGGDRTVGKGQFEPAFSEYEGNLFNAKDSSSFVTLSMFLPSKKEIQDGLLSGENVSYEIAKRGGWIYSDFSKSQRKRSVRMFEEGSVFKNTGKEFYGKVINVAPEGFKYHPVLKNGLAFGANI
jgi:CRISPR-associated protein Csm4